MDEIKCTCCGKEWDSNKIIGIEETWAFKKVILLYMRHWSKAYNVTYQLVCKDCNIETPFTKWFWAEDFKPACKNKV